MKIREREALYVCFLGTSNFTPRFHPTTLSKTAFCLMKNPTLPTTKPFEFNWGHGIVLAFALFILFIGTLVYRMITTDIEMAKGYNGKPQSTQPK